MRSDLPNVPDDDLSIPDSILSVIGELAVFDHWKQRVVFDCQRHSSRKSSQTEIEVAYDEAVNRLTRLAEDGAKAIHEPLLGPPVLDGELPSVVS